MVEALEALRECADRMEAIQKLHYYPLALPIIRARAVLAKYAPDDGVSKELAMSTNHFDLVRGQLSVGRGGRIMRSGVPTAWVMVRRGPGRHRAVIAGTVSDDRCSCSQDTVLDLVAERIVADECDRAAIAKYAPDKEGGAE